MTAAQFRQAGGRRGEGLDYFCNTRVAYALRGMHIKLDVLWNWEAPAGGGDTHLAVTRFTKSRVEVRQGAAEKGRPELYVVRAMRRRRLNGCAWPSLRPQYPGIGVEDDGERVPGHHSGRYRVGHEAHFAQVTNQFFTYLKHPLKFPRVGEPDMLAKYYVSTKGVELSRPRRS